MWKLITAESFPGSCRDAAVRTVCKTEGLTALQAGPGAQHSCGPGSWWPHFPGLPALSGGSCPVTVITWSSQSPQPVLSAVRSLAEACSVLPGVWGAAQSGKNVALVAKRARELGDGPCAGGLWGEKGKGPRCPRSSFILRLQAEPTVSNPASNSAARLRGP